MEPQARAWRNLERRGWITTGSGCHEWRGAGNDKGYGQIRTLDGIFYTHRVSFINAKGPIPRGMFVLHECDNPPCLNPDHLFLGTNLDNVRDMDMKGRRVSAVGLGNARTKFPDEVIESIRADVCSSTNALAEKYGVSASHMSRIRRGQRRKELA